LQDRSYVQLSIVKSSSWKWDFLFFSLLHAFKVVESHPPRLVGSFEWFRSSSPFSFTNVFTKCSSISSSYFANATTSYSYFVNATTSNSYFANATTSYSYFVNATTSILILRMQLLQIFVVFLFRHYLVLQILFVFLFCECNYFESFVSFCFVIV